MRKLATQDAPDLLPLELWSEQPATVRISGYFSHFCFPLQVKFSLKSVPSYRGTKHDNHWIASLNALGTNDSLRLLH